MTKKEVEELQTILLAIIEAIEDGEIDLTHIRQWIYKLDSLKRKK